MKSVVRLIAAMFILLGPSLSFAGKHPVPLEKNTDSAKCIECHNSDDNREFGGLGPNGPHGSSNPHILERPYVASQVVAGTGSGVGPGSLITNLNPMVAPYPQLDPGSNGPYSLCAKCHNLQNIMTDASFAKHNKHISAGISCSVCHSAHGVASGSAGLPGKRLVNFDLNVVAPSGGVLTYAGGTCTMTCHMVQHNSDGTITNLITTPPSTPLTTATPSLLKR